MTKQDLAVFVLVTLLSMAITVAIIAFVLRLFGMI